MTFKAFWIEKSDSGFKRSLVERDVEDLPEGDVLIDVSFSSLNYKDGLSATGNPGVTRNFPHTPGIDAAGKVAGSTDSKFSIGDEVVVIGFDLGMNTAGVPLSQDQMTWSGFSMPSSLMTRKAMRTASRIPTRLGET